MQDRPAHFNLSGLYCKTVIINPIEIGYKMGEATGKNRAEEGNKVHGRVVVERGVEMFYSLGSRAN